jgi:uncharacterized protein (DUF433 family)
MDQTLTIHIETKPTVCGGKPCVAGTRIRVQDIHVWHNLQGLSADKIASRFPQLTLADIYAALTYYWDHRDEIQRQMREETDLVESLKRKNPSPLQDARTA